MEFRIADTFTESLSRLTTQEQKATKTTAFDLQLDASAPGLSFHKLDRAKGLRKQYSPLFLRGLVGDLVVADLQHGARQAARAGVLFQGKVDAIGRRIRLVDADCQVAARLQCSDQRRSEPRVLVMDDSDLPRPRHAFVDRREGMHGNDPGLLPRCQAPDDHGVDCVMERPPATRDPRLALAL